MVVKKRRRRRGNDEIVLVERCDWCEIFRRQKRTGDGSIRIHRRVRDDGTHVFENKQQESSDEEKFGKRGRKRGRGW